MREVMQIYLHNRYRESQTDCHYRRTDYKKLDYTERSAIIDANHPLIGQTLNIPTVQGLRLREEVLRARLTAVFIVSVPYFLSSDPDLSVLLDKCDKLFNE